MPNFKTKPIFARTQTSPRKSLSSAHNLTIHASAARRCAHVKMSGRPCAAPAQRDSDFCIFHAGDYEGRYPTPGVYEDAASIQLEISHTIRRLQDRKIEAPEAGRILYALQVASQNLPNLRDELESVHFPYLPDQLTHFLMQGLEPPDELRDEAYRRCTELAYWVRDSLHRMPKLPGSEPPAPARDEDAADRNDA
jgi:hypothetical protein